MKTIIILMSIAIVVIVFTLGILREKYKSVLEDSQHWKEKNKELEAKIIILKSLNKKQLSEFKENTNKLIEEQEKINNKHYIEIKNIQESVIQRFQKISSEYESQRVYSLVESEDFSLALGISKERKKDLLNLVSVNLKNKKPVSENLEEISSKCKHANELVYVAVHYGARL